MSESRDQAAHVAAAAIGLLPAALFPGVIAFAWAGFCMGMAREITEEGGPVTLAKTMAAATSWRDLAAWTVGGAFVGALV